MFSSFSPVGAARLPKNRVKLFLTKFMQIKAKSRYGWWPGNVSGGH